MHERDNADADPSTHEIVQTTPPDVVDKLATLPPDVVDIHTTSEQTSDPKPATATLETSTKEDEDPAAAASTRDTSVVPKMVRVFDKAATPAVEASLKKSKPQAKQKAPTKARKEIDLILDQSFYKTIIGLDDIPDLPDCPRTYEHGKPFLPDWAFAHEEVPGEMRRFHGWYKKACRLGVREVSVHIPGEVLQTLAKTTIVDFLKFHNMFRLGWVDITAMTIWCL